jgi:hypothetical protein
VASFTWPLHLSTYLQTMTNGSRTSGMWVYVKQELQCSQGTIL